MKRWMKTAGVVAGICACRGHAPVREEAAAPVEAAPPAPPADFDAAPTEDGLGMRLYDAKPGAGADDRAAVAAGTPLTGTEIEALLTRTTPLVGEEGVAFAMRPATAPPPRTGATKLEAFPPPPSAVAPPASTPGSLTVTRHSPDGEVPMAPNLSVSFSSPMIAVGAVSEVAAIHPVTISPTPPGAWRWLGTQTLLFQPDVRFPMATTYEVEVPAGTRTATGGTLSQAVRWSFATPAPSLQEAWPGSVVRSGRVRVTDAEPQPATPLLWLGFDQRVDPAQIASHARLSSSGATFPLRLATAEEIAKDPRVAALVKGAEPGRGVALQPVSPLPLATSYTVTIPAGTPSAEGPRLTTADQSFGFRTYAPLALTSTTCWYGTPCPPESGWSVSFNNPLDEAAFDPATVTVEPAVPGLSVVAQGASLSVSGNFVGRTVYHLHIPATLRDHFGQTLGAARTVDLAVGPADRQMTGPPEGMVVLDPAAPPKLSFFTTNQRSLKVEVYAVEPENWKDWQAWLNRYRYDDAHRVALPGRRVASLSVPVANQPDASVETGIDLAPYLQGGLGQLLVYVQPGEQPKDRWNRQEWYGWVQGTRLGLTAFVDGEDVYAWTTALADGKTAAGVDVSLSPAGGSGRSGADGLTRLALADSTTDLLVARSGKDVAILPADTNGWGGGWQRVIPQDTGLWYTFTDRNLYKPGEAVHVKGWLRMWKAQRPTDVAALPKLPSTVRWRLMSSMGNPLGEGTATVGAAGGFDFATTLPKTPDLGSASFELSADLGIPGDSTSLPLDIEEFRTPEFEVTASGADGVYTLGEDAVVDLAAKYYAGGGLPGAAVTWSVSASPSSFVPPNRSDWSFGAWSPWWYRGGYGFTRPSVAESFSAVTDASGDQHLGIHFDSLRPARPMTVHAEASVMDVNRQAWSASKDFLVHPSALYVGLQADHPFLEKGKPLTIRSLVVDRDGAAVVGTSVAVRMTRLDWQRVRGQWTEVEVDGTDCSLVSGADAGACTFTPAVGGEWRVRATVKDAQGRPNETELRIYVSGAAVTPDRGVAAREVTLVPEKEELQPGETVELFVRSPFGPAEGVYTVRRDGVRVARPFHVEGDSTTLHIPVDETLIPGFTVQVDLVGSEPRRGDDGEVLADKARQVAYATGSLAFQVPPKVRTLGVAVTPAASKLAPGGSTSVDVRVTGPDGAPVKDAELAVVAVDEAVLSLSAYRLPDPLAVFYASRDGYVQDASSRAWVQLGRPGSAANSAADGVGGAPGGGLGGLGAVGRGYGGGGKAPMMEAMAAPAMAPQGSATVERKLALQGDMAKDKSSMAPDEPAPGPTSTIALRSDFNPLAVWAPAVRTDGDGRARVDLKLPDSLTRYRVMVVAVSGANRFGSGEADVTARLPLMVRPSAPRFLNFGDHFELPVVLQNQTDAAMTVDVALAATNLHLEGGSAVAGVEKAGRRVSVPANDRVEVRFPASAVDAGTARFQVVAASGAASDAASISLPVWTPATTEAFATYGVLDASGVVTQPILPPSGVFPQFGGLTITTSSTQLQALTDAVLYLVQYPYDCNEQIASRILAIGGLRDVLGAFSAPGLPAPKELESTVASDLERLGRRQNPNGGFAFWRRGDPDWPYLTIHATHAMVVAEQKGYAVDPAMKQRSLGYLRTIESHLPSWYSKESKWSLRAYALSVRALAGDPDVGKANALVAEAAVDHLPPEAMGWILPTLHTRPGGANETAIRTWLTNHVAESAAGAHFVTGYEDGAYVLLHSDRRVDGVLLDALVQTDPKNPLIPKLVNGLLAHRVQGRWDNTEENSLILLAMDRYFHAYESVTPDFVARAWLGAGFAGEHTFRGYSTERSETDVPMAWLQSQGGAQDLVLQKDGAGRMYYRVGLQYAPTDLRLPPSDQGFTVERRYEAVDAPTDVRRDDEGVWHVKAGARVRVKLEMVTPMRRYHVALVDPLPAGLEVMNPDLAGTGTLPTEESAAPGPFWWWERTWYEHENLRDDRVEAYTSLLWDGVWSYTYVARATTPGSFVVPPAKAEEMYAPETFGRSAGDRVIVE